MPKLFIEAANNDNFIKQRYNDTITNLGNNSRLADFNVNVRTSARLSVNMRPHVVLSLLYNGFYENIYQQAKRISSISNRTIDQELQRLLGSYYKKRVSLDSVMEIPENSYYAALNFGGLGAPRYGSICIILGGLAINRNDAVFIAKDSLNNFVDDDGNVNISELVSNACSSFALPELCCIKHLDDPLLDDPISWPGMACNDNVYVEAVVNQDMTSALVSEIRIEKNEYDALMELALGGMYGKSKGNAERALAQDFLNIVVKARECRIPISALEIMP
ncbi:hypothetical protein [Rhizobium sp. CSW-27]|uniref:hypothetical protein n=1 Tax=Rhizobium sp. CSW-27 TaxID=2839985 RepID=UPI001C034013|nr:hypothetical protein [Rhizobium sp. CSW-27]MBT9371104.1 hypothetical protein [Rhizobium sp. CSW-27]